MTVNRVDHDALTELFNIGLHKAAASLSELTGQRIIVDLPRLWVCPIEETHLRLRELDAGARVIVVSADVQRSTAKLVAESGALRFLGKPVSSEGLLEAVREALAAGTT